MGCYRGSTSGLTKMNGRGTCTPNNVQRPCQDINCNCDFPEEMSTSCQNSNKCTSRRRRSPFSKEEIQARVQAQREESLITHRRAKRGVTMNCDGRERNDPGNPCDFKRANKQASCKAITTYDPSEYISYDDDQ